MTLGRSLLLAFFALLPFPTFAEGFAGLGQGQDGFPEVTAGYDFKFPQDHGAHFEHRIEWWYLTSALQGENGLDYGVQWTLFRTALSPQGPHVWMGHMGITTPNAHYSAERFARHGVGQAGVQEEPFEAWIDEWRLTSQSSNIDQIEAHAGQDNVSFTLALQANGPLVFHGDEGFSVKSDAGQASYYFSQPFYEAQGVLNLPDGDIAVSGQAWLDREWSSQPLASDQEGWDWFSLHLNSGEKVMLFQLRGAQTYTYASWINAEGGLEAVSDAEFSPLAWHHIAERKVPVAWRLEIPSKDFAVETTPVNPNAWQSTLIPYWEGPVRFEGSHEGRGYLEMTGYE